MGEGLAIARSVANELDAARFDPLLVRSVAQGANIVLENFIERVDKLVRHIRRRCFGISDGILLRSSKIGQLPHSWELLLLLSNC